MNRCRNKIRELTLLRHLTLAFAISALVSFGCGDDGDGSAVDSGPEVDSGPGRDGGPDIDAAIQPGACGVQVGTIDIPAGIIAVFSNPDGSLIATEALVDGAASRSDCVANTMITLFVNTAPVMMGNGPPADAIFITFAGVDPGDTVVFEGDQTEPADIYASANVTGAATTGLDPDSYKGYHYLGCTSGGYDYNLGEPYSFDHFINGYDNGCLGTDMTIDAISWLYDGGYNRVGYAFTKGAAVAGGPTYGEHSQTDIVQPAWTLHEPFPSAFTIHNPPPFATAANWGAWHGADFVEFDGSGSGGEYAEGFPPVMTIQGEWGLPPEFADFSAHYAQFYYPPLPTFGIAEPALVYTSVAGQSAYNDSQELDYMGTALPRVAGVILTTETAARPVVNWVSDSSMAAADGFFSAFVFGSEGPRGLWMVIGPPGSGTSFQVPAMPESLTEFVPQSGEQFVNFGAAFFGLSWASLNDMYASGLRFEGMFELFSPEGGTGLPPMLDISMIRSVWVNYQLLDLIFEEE